MITGVLLGISLAAAAAAALAALVFPARVRPLLTGILTACCGGFAVAAGVNALTGRSWSGEYPDLLPLFGISLRIDPLSGLIVAVIGAVAVVAAIYQISAADGDLRTRALQIPFPIFVAAMLLVPLSADATGFLLFWELMTVASLVLVVGRARTNQAAVSAGLWYGIMAHIAFVAILIGFVLLAARAGSDRWADLARGAESMPGATRSLVFLLLFAGFACKAGLVPLHAWLPRAEGEAPNHVSALMSAAMKNIAIYGIILTGFTVFRGGARWWWMVVLLVGLLSAVYGILRATVGSDINRILAYSTSENMGLIVVGIGAAGLFNAAGNHLLAGLALAAALLHVINHAGFKSLLFLGGGAVISATGLRDLDRYGGLRTRMPKTALLFAIGCLAASALPLGNAFVSEWLLLQSLIHGLPASGISSAILMPMSVALVALTAGLAMATFVKTFGLTFLARPRSDEAVAAREVSAPMLGAMALAALACVALAVWPAAVLPGVGEAVSSSGLSATDTTRGALTIRLTGFASSLSPMLVMLAVLAAVLAAAVGVRAVSTSRARRAARLWDCGAGPLTPRMEYTATSFAEPLQRIFSDVVQPELDVNVTHAVESDYLIKEIEYTRRVPDPIEKKVYAPIITFFNRWGRAGRKIANGSIHRYMGYGFVGLLIILVALAVTAP